jgi:hypothetical protein
LSGLLAVIVFEGKGGCFSRGGAFFLFSAELGVRSYPLVTRLPLFSASFLSGQGGEQEM